MEWLRACYLPHFGQRLDSRLPHSAQNFFAPELLVPHLVQRMGGILRYTDTAFLYHPAWHGDQRAVVSWYGSSVQSAGALQVEHRFSETLWQRNSVAAYRCGEQRIERLHLCPISLKHYREIRRLAGSDETRTELDQTSYSLANHNDALSQLSKLRLGLAKKTPGKCGLMWTQLRKVG